MLLMVIIISIGRSELYKVSPVRNSVRKLGVNDGYLQQHNVMSFVLVENHLFLSRKAV